MSQSDRANTIHPSEENIFYLTDLAKSDQISLEIAGNDYDDAMIIFFLISYDSGECGEVFKVYNEQLMEV